VDQEDFAALGLYDPTDDHAELRLELLCLLADLGATSEDLVAYSDNLPGLALVLAVQGGAAMNLDEAAERSGLQRDELRRLVRAAGFPDPEPGTRAFTEGLVGLAAGLDSVKEIFGEAGLYQLVRVLGAAMARVADTVVSTFLVNVEPEARRQDPVGLAVAKANVEASSLLPLVPVALDVLFRQHLLAAQRTALADEDLVGYETQHLVVGFVDLVGSTELTERLTTRQLGEVIGAFENIALDTVTGGGGRVVKLIGDQVLFTAPDSASGGNIALRLSAACHEHRLLPEVRAGLASGKVMLREGDVFGHVVNLAARIVKRAQPGEVLTTAEVAKESGLAASAPARHELRGLSGGVDLSVLEGTM
jgi:adenylate cyclase